MPVLGGSRTPPACQQPIGVFFENETGPGHRCVPMRPGAPPRTMTGGVRVTGEIATRATPTLSSPIISRHTQSVRAGHPPIHARHSSYNAAGVGSTPTAKRSKPRERGRSRQFVDPSAAGFR